MVSCIHRREIRIDIKSQTKSSLKAGDTTYEKETFQFDVSNFFMFGSPISLVLAYRRNSLNRLNSIVDLQTPNCQQIYNLFHPSNPIVARLEPLLSPPFTLVPPVNIPRYQLHPHGDGQQLNIEEFLKANYPLVGQPQGNSTPLTLVSVRRLSNESFQSGIFDTQQAEAVSSVKESWLGEKRVDFALYCPEGLANFPTHALPHLFHASYWESADVISFI